LGGYANVTSEEVYFADACFEGKQASSSDTSRQGYSGWQTLGQTISFARRRKVANWNGNAIWYGATDNQTSRSKAQCSHKDWIARIAADRHSGR